MDKEFLSNVYGYSKVKNELFVIRDWYLNSSEMGEKKRLLPKGILFYGRPGCGKTQLMREYSKSFNYPIFVIEGKEDNVQEEVCNIYEKAKQEKNAIVIIDELDRLVGQDEKLVRIIMSQLDGFDSSTSILTIATCNEYFELPEALIREGRFDRHFFIGNTDGEMEDIIRSFAKDSNIELSNEDIMELAICFDICTTGEIKAIFNNASLRYGNKCTIDDIINTSDYLRTGYMNKDSDFNVPRYAAIHEAGHAIYSHIFCKTKTFLRIYFNDDGGVAVCKESNMIETKESRINCVRVGLAGLVAEDIILNNHDIGCGDDLEKAYDLSFRLINRTCINGIKNYCTKNAYYDRYNMSDFSSKKFDKRTISFVKANYRIVKRKLKKYKKEIITLADYLQEHKEIKRNEFIKLVGMPA